MDRINVDISKIYMIHSFSLIGFAYLFFFGIKDLGVDNNILSIFLLSGSALFAFNIIYLFRTKNHIVSGSIILYFLSVLMLYLLYTGGIENTGHLWIFFLAPLIFYVLGLRNGVLFVLLFVSLMMYIFYLSDSQLNNTIYTSSYKLRIILSFLLTALISGAYAFAKDKATYNLLTIKKELEYISIHDDLTGLYNRRAYHTKIKTIDTIDGAFLMCDIDKFKIINDKYGHTAGDYVIRQVAKCIHGNIRKDDIAIRWGGEEFFIFLTDTKIKDAYNVAEALRKAIENVAIEYNNKRIPVTISIGVAALTRGMPIIEDAVKKADDAMYHSKRDGRNRTTIAY